MSNNNGFKAEVDGREVPVEIIEDEKDEGASGDRVFFRSGSVVPFVITGIILAGIVVLSLTLFIWALPLLVPLFLVLFILRLIARR